MVQGRSPDGYKDVSGASGGSAGLTEVTRIRGNVVTTYSTIGAALATAAAGDVVLVGPGNYPESFSVPAGVIMRAPTRGSVTITGAAATGTRVTLGANCRFENFFVDVPTDAVPAVNPGAGCIITNLSLNGQGGAGIGLQISQPNVFVIDGFAWRGNGGIILDIAAGGSSARIENLNFITGVVSTIVRAADGFEIGPVRSILATAISPVGFDLLAGADMISDGALFTAGTVSIAVRINADDITAVFTGPNFSIGTVTTAFSIDPAVTTGNLSVLAGRFSRDAIEGPDAYLQQDTVVLVFSDEKLGDEGLLVEGELVQGAPVSGQGAAFGEGNSYTKGMVVLREVGGVFTNITSDLLLPDGNTVALFDTGAIGDRLYVGGDRALTGIFTDITTALVLGVGTTLTFEVSDGGGGWVTVAVMVADAAPPHERNDQAVFQRVGEDQIRFGEGIASQAAQAVDGTTKFWWRVTIGVAALAVVPVGEQIKLGPNRFESADGGFIEYFGSAIKPLTVPAERRPLVGAAPSPAQFDVAPGYSFTAVNSRFNNNQRDGFAGIVRIPVNTDTSQLALYKFEFKPNDNTSGNVNFILTTGLIGPGAVLDGVSVPVTSDTFQVAVPLNSQGLLIQVERTVDLRNAGVSDELFFALERDGAADTYNGNIGVAPDDEIEVKVYY